MARKIRRDTAGIQRCVSYIFRQRLEIMMKFQLKDLSINYRVEGEGTPVLLLHGRPTDHQAMVAAFEPIFEKHAGWQRVYVDLPGMGDTTGGNWLQSNEDVIEAMNAFVEGVIGKRPFLIVGFSYGGHIGRGLLYKKMAQVAGMMLFVPAMSDFETRILGQHRVFGQDTALFSQYPQPMAEMFAGSVVVHEADVIARQADIVPGMQKADQATLARIGTSYTFTFPVDELASKYERPILIITGKQDNITGYEQAGEFAKKFPRATYAVLDRAGHGLHMEQPALFNALTHEWLDRVEEDMAP